MIEQKLQQMGMSLTIGVFTDVYSTIPSIAEFLERVAKYKFYESVLARNIDHEGNVGIISCDEKVVTQIRDALISQNVPFTIVGTEAFHAELRQFRKNSDKDNPNALLPTNDDILNNEKIDVLAKKLEYGGEYTFFIPTNFVTTTLSQKEIDAYLSLDNRHEGFQSLRPEDGIALPPAGSCTLLDIILANAYINELREEYGIKIEEKAQDIEKDAPEQEEDLERELGDGSNRDAGVVEDTTQEAQTAPEKITPEATEESSDKEKKQKKKKKNTQRYSSERNNAQSYHEHDNTSPDATPYQRSGSTQSETHESTRTGGMSVSGNLAHDSFNVHDEAKTTHYDDGKKASVEYSSDGNSNSSTNPQATQYNSQRNADSAIHSSTQAPHSTERDYRSNPDSNENPQAAQYDSQITTGNSTHYASNQGGTSTREDVHEKTRTGGMSVSENRAHDSFRTHGDEKTTRPNDSKRSSAERNYNRDFNSNADSQADRYESQKIASPTYHSSNQGGISTKEETHENTRSSKMSASENRAHDSFKTHYEAKVAHLDDSQRVIIEQRTGGDLSGNMDPQAVQYSNQRSENRSHSSTTTPPPIKSLSAGREILFDNHASQSGTTWASAIKKTATERGSKKGSAFTRPIKEAIKEAVMGEGSEGGAEARKYTRNTAPVARFVMQEAQYAASMAAAREVMHDAGTWAKAYAASRGEPNTANAEAYIEAMLQKAGIDSKDLDGKNIIEVRDALKNVSTAHATISRMSDAAMKEWMEKNGTELPQGLQPLIQDYRQKLNSLNSLQKPDPNDFDAMQEYREIKSTSTKEVRTSLKNLTKAAANTSTTLRQLKDEIDRLQGEITSLLAQANNMTELVNLLKAGGYSQKVIDEMQKMSFDVLKNGSAIDLIKQQFDYEGLLKKITATKELQFIVFEGNISSIGALISKMDSSAFGAFLQSYGVSDDVINQVLKLGKDRITLNPEILNAIIKKASGADKVLLKSIQGHLKLENARVSSYRRLAAGIAKKVLQNAFGNSEGANALWETTGYLGNAKRITSTGIKISMKISNRIFGENAAVSRGLQAAAHPAKFAGKKLAKTAAGKAVANSRAVMKTTKFLSKAHKLAHAPGRFVGKATRSAAKGIGKLVSTGARHVAGAVGKLLGVNITTGAASGAAGAAAGGAAAGGAAAGTLAGGWIVLIVICVLMLLNAMISKLNSASTETSGNYQYAQFDADFQTEILNELQNLNDSFEETVNRAATDRTFWSSVDGFSETDSVTFYENGAYSVYFRDEEGNELDHLDINNSKAILDMATQYCKYANWIKPSENASEDTKLAYEQIKQYYLDYCKFLWVSTHRITIEEYRPGDGTHADDDQSGLTTNAQGICPKNGTTVWLDKNFKPGEKTAKGTKYICGVNNGYATSPGTCNLLDRAPFDAVYRDYGDYAICTHPKENLNSGWKIVVDENNNPVTQDHYICTEGHKCNHGTRKDPDYVYHYCGDYCSKKDITVYYDSCKHTDYQWEYHCGGHMGAVIYVTVGDVSRLKDMSPAKDIDTSELSNYPENSNDAYTQEISPETLAPSTEAEDNN